MTSIGVQDLAFLKVFSWNQRVHDLFVHCWKVCRCLTVMAPATQARPARNRRNRSTKSRAVSNQNGADHDLNGNPRRDLRVDFLWYVCKRRGGWGWGKRRCLKTGTSSPRLTDMLLFLNLFVSRIYTYVGIVGRGSYLTSAT